ncbi:unnamed protein product [Effrenium voratum]|uniref:Uncharacterized protein n=1 Tax=Effrenium voratum TaxID=2562239 RepID=A0AA36HV17_9DINO|nr:unnamed protein product [Effrenium voratum]
MERPASASSGGQMTGQLVPTVTGSRCMRGFSRCGSPALAARQSRLAQEAKRLCHLAASEDCDVKGTATCPPTLLPDKGTWTEEERGRWAEAVQWEAEGQHYNAGLDDEGPWPDERGLRCPTAQLVQGPAPPASVKAHKFASGRAMALLQAARSTSNSPSPMSKAALEVENDRYEVPDRPTSRSSGRFSVTERSVLERASAPRSKARAKVTLLANEDLPPHGVSRLSVPDAPHGVQKTVSREIRDIHTSSTTSTRPASPSHEEPGEKIGPSPRSVPSEAARPGTEPGEALKVSLPLTLWESTDQHGRSRSRNVKVDRPSTSPSPTPRSAKEENTDPSSPPQLRIPRKAAPPPSPASAVSGLSPSPRLRSTCGTSREASMSRAASPEPEVTSLTHRGQLFQARFTNVKRRGRSLSPPAREHATASWRGPDHIPVTCVIKRRRQKKGPKEKLLILPFVASEADTRFSHLFETLEAKQPDLMLEGLLNHGPFSCARVY